MAARTALQSTTASGVSLTSEQTIGAYAASAGQILKPVLRLSSLNGAAATYTVAIRNTTDGADVYGYSEPKRKPTDSGKTFLFPAFEASAKTYAIQVTGTNASDSATWAVEWCDATTVDAVAISGDTTAADNLETACDGGTYNLGGGAIVAASVTAGVTVATNSDKTGYSLSSAGAQAIWDALTSGLTTVGSIGKWLLDAIGAIPTTSPGEAPSAATVAAAVVAALDDSSVSTPNTQTGRRNIVSGDTYSATARQLLVTKAAGAEWPTDLSDGWTWTIAVNKANVNGNSEVPATIAGTVAVVTATGDSQSVRVSIAASATASARGLYNYSIQGTNSGEEWTLEYGELNVIEDQT